MAPYTRREFLETLIAGTVTGTAAMLTGCDRSAGGRVASPLKIDMHLHIFESVEAGREVKRFPIWEYGSKTDLIESESTGTVEEAIRDIEAAGLDHAVVASVLPANLAREQARAEWPEFPSERETEHAEAELHLRMEAELREYNEWATGLARSHPAFIPFVGADLGAPPSFDHLAMLEELQQDKGARGIKIHPVIDRRAVNDRAMWPIYEACVKLGLPVLSHSGPSPADSPVQHGEPNAFFEVLREFPDLKLVVAHLGGASWKQTFALAEAFPNLLFDACEIIAFDGAPNAPTREELARLIERIGPHRVAFGSDYPWYDIDTTIDQLMDLPILSTSEKEGILGRNAAEYLGLEG